MRHLLVFLALSSCSLSHSAMLVQGTSGVPASAVTTDELLQVSANTSSDWLSVGAKVGVWEFSATGSGLYLGHRTQANEPPQQLVRDVQFASVGALETSLKKWPVVLPPQAASPPQEADTAARAADLRSRIESTPRLPFRQTDLPIKVPNGKALGMVSWMSHDSRTGLTWLIQRGNSVAPVLAVDGDGNVVHSFGTGLFTIPHAIRVAPDGNIWTVDAGSSKVMEFNPEGKVLLQLDVSRQSPASETPFAGATDVAFAKGHIFISDGYRNARILEYTQQGKPIREWGSPGSGPGQFFLPHCIVAAGNTLYVADRENGRIEEFDLNGRFLREIDGLGRVYALQVDAHGDIWATMAPFNQPPGSAGWIVEINGNSGKIIGYIPVVDTPALHAVDLIPDGELITDVGNHVIRFRRAE